MKKLLLTIFTFFLIFISIANAKEDIRIRVTNFPPQYVKNSNGNWTGLDVELSRALVETAGFKAKFVELPWSRSLTEMKNGSIIQLMTALSKTPERSTYMYWIGPERVSKMVLVVRHEDQNMNISSLNDLIDIATKRSLHIGMQQDLYYGKEFSRVIEEPRKAIHFESVATVILNLRKLKAGRILGFFEEELSLRYRIKTDENYHELTIHPFILHQENVFFGVTRTIDTNILNRLQKAYEKLDKSGELKRIQNNEW